MTPIYIILSVFLVSIASFVGAITLLFKKDILDRIIFYLISLSAGVILGDVFIHLLPEVGKNAHYISNISVIILFGFVIFFIFERFIIWWHHHMPVQDQDKHLDAIVYTILLGDSLHNFVDGIIVASSFLVNVPIGVATTIAIIFHEIPHELGNFAVLIKSGLTPKKALLINFISAITAILGAILILLIGNTSEYFLLTMTSFTIGGFIYIACSDLIPELNKAHLTLPKAFIQLSFFLFGIGIMGLLA